MNRYSIIVAAAILLGACSSAPVDIAPKTTAQITGSTDSADAGSGPSPIPSAAPLAATGGYPESTLATPAPKLTHDELPPPSTAPLPQIEADPDGLQFDIDVEEIDQLLADLDILLLDLDTSLADEAQEEIWRQGDHNDE
jgi:hypothetical protein